MVHAAIQNEAAGEDILTPPRGVVILVFGGHLAERVRLHGDQAPQFTGAHDVAQFDQRWLVAIVFRDHPDQIGRLGVMRQQFTPDRDSRCDGFFADDVLPGIQRLVHDVRDQRDRQHDVDRVDILARQQIVNAGGRIDRVLDLLRQPFRGFAAAAANRGNCEGIAQGFNRRNVRILREQSRANQSNTYWFLCRHNENLRWGEYAV